MWDWFQVIREAMNKAVDKHAIEFPSELFLGSRHSDSIHPKVSPVAFEPR